MLDQGHLLVLWEDRLNNQQALEGALGELVLLEAEDVLRYRWSYAV
jgi:hypothetical protein